MPTNEELLFQSILLVIENNDIIRLRKLLAKLPISRMDPDIIVGLLVTFTESAKKWGSAVAVREVIYYFDDLPDEARVLNSDSIFFKLFGNRRVSDSLLVFIASCFSQPDSEIVTWSEVIDVLIEHDSDPSAGYACKRSILVYGEQPLDTYNSFLSIAEDAENVSVSAFLEEKIKSLSPYADSPSYVSDFTNSSELPTEFSIQLRFPDLISHLDESSILGLTNEQAADTVIEGYKSLGYDVVDPAPIRHAFFDAWQKLDILGKRAFISESLGTAVKLSNYSNDNLELFRLMGPSNPSIEFTTRLLDHDPDDLCQLYGCRMLYCNCGDISFNTYDELPDDYDSSYDWFLRPGEDYPTCDYCLKKLRSRSDAVRIPLIDGGWRGRYCNDLERPFDCALNHLSEIEHNSSNPANRDVIQLQMIDIYSTELSQLGIQNRTG